jgi:hypothetical protein
VVRPRQSYNGSDTGIRQTTPERIHELKFMSNHVKPPQNEPRALRLWLQSTNRTLSDSCDRPRTAHPAALATVPNPRNCDSSYRPETMVSRASMAKLPSEKCSQRGEFGVLANARSQLNTTHK